MEDIKIYIGKQIKERRKDAKITQEDFGTYLGLTRTSVINIESGRHGTTAEAIWKICNMLHCTPNDLFPNTKPARRKYRWIEKTIRVPKKVMVKKLMF